jgi:glycosyltransferase involved in cell wall biosynthesis
VRVGLYSDHLRTDGQVGTGNSKYIYYLTKELRYLGVDVVPLHKGDNPEDVDVLHDPHAPWNAPLRPRRPLIITIHDLAPATFPEYFDRWVRFLFLQKMRWFVRRARRIIADSHRSAQVVGERMHPGVPVAVVPLGVEDKFRELPTVPPANPYLVQVGVHRKIKEPWTTFRAFETIANRIPHQLLFVGERPAWLKPLESYLADRPALMNRVRFDWPGEDGLATVYNQASLVVHPCPEEGFGFVPLEALACGAHVLARAPAVREILGPYGCYFDDPASLGDKILGCLSEGPRGTLRDRSNHAQQFTFRRMAQQTLATYEEAVP